MSNIYSSYILCWQGENIEIKHSYRATNNRRRNSKVFCMYGSVALRSPIPTFFDRRATDLQLTRTQLLCIVHMASKFSCFLSERAEFNIYIITITPNTNFPWTCLQKINWPYERFRPTLELHFEPKVLTYTRL